MQSWQHFGRCDCLLMNQRLPETIWLEYQTWKTTHRELALLGSPHALLPLVVPQQQLEA